MSQAIARALRRLVEVCELQGRATESQDMLKAVDDARLHLRMNGNLLRSDELAGDMLADVLVAAAEGKTVQQLIHDGGVMRFTDLVDNTGPALIRFLTNYSERTFRVKPEPLVRWCPLGPSGNVFAHSIDRAAAVVRCGELGVPKLLRLELDPDNDDVIDARTETP